MDIPCQTVFEYPSQPYPQVPEAYEWPYGLPCYPTQQRENSYVGAPSHIDSVTGQMLRKDYREDVVGMPPAMVMIPASLQHSYSPTVLATFRSFSGLADQDPVRLGIRASSQCDGYDDEDELRLSTDRVVQPSTPAQAARIQCGVPSSEVDDDDDQDHVRLGGKGGSGNWNPGTGGGGHMGGAGGGRNSGLAKGQNPWER